MEFDQRKDIGFPRERETFTFSYRTLFYGAALLAVFGISIAAKVFYSSHHKSMDPIDETYHVGKEKKDETGARQSSIHHTKQDIEKQYFEVFQVLKTDPSGTNNGELKALTNHVIDCKANAINRFHLKMSDTTTNSIFYSYECSKEMMMGVQEDLLPRHSYFPKSSLMTVYESQVTTLTKHEVNCGGSNVLSKFHLKYVEDWSSLEYIYICTKFDYLLSRLVNTPKIEFPIHSESIVFLTKFDIKCLDNEVLQSFTFKYEKLSLSSSNEALATSATSGTTMNENEDISENYLGWYEYTCCAIGMSPSPSSVPTSRSPSSEPTVSPSSGQPTSLPTAPSPEPTVWTSRSPTFPSPIPSIEPSAPTISPAPTVTPTESPTHPSYTPTRQPSKPSSSPTRRPTEAPTVSFVPTNIPTVVPSSPSSTPTETPSSPTVMPTGGKYFVVSKLKQTPAVNAGNFAVAYLSQTAVYCKENAINGFDVYYKQIEEKKYVLGYNYTCVTATRGSMTFNSTEDVPLQKTIASPYGYYISTLSYHRPDCRSVEITRYHRPMNTTWAWMNRNKFAYHEKIEGVMKYIQITPTTIVYGCNFYGGLQCRSLKTKSLPTGNLKLGHVFGGVNFLSGFHVFCNHQEALQKFWFNHRGETGYFEYICCTLTT